MVSKHWRTTLDELKTLLEQEEGADVDYVLENLVTSEDIAKEYGFVSRNHIWNVEQRHEDFPAPVKVFGRVKVWWRPDIEDYYRNKRARKRTNGVRNQ